MDEITEAEWAEGLPDTDGYSRYWQVGNKYLTGKSLVIITRITVQTDLPGMYCNLRRVCAWHYDTLLAEAPLHNIQAVGYVVNEALGKQND